LVYKSVPATNRGLIQYSDHDAVYSLMTVNKLRILVMTWNAGNIVITENDKGSETSNPAGIVLNNL
jgi:hypothetical protein